MILPRNTDTPLPSIFQSPKSDLRQFVEGEIALVFCAHRHYDTTSEYRHSFALVCAIFPTESHLLSSTVLRVSVTLFYLTPCGISSVTRPLPTYRHSRHFASRPTVLWLAVEVPLPRLISTLLQRPSARQQTNWYNIASAVLSLSVQFRDRKGLSSLRCRRRARG